ncbi:hypothetical protein C8J56DRAFT_358575 [Mycena floridula]|nr:hypothetical protein C8J56DRAFT_358575 [Mycena floridula]
MSTRVCRPLSLYTLWQCLLCSRSFLSPEMHQEFGFGHYHRQPNRALSPGSVHDDFNRANGLPASFIYTASSQFDPHRARYFSSSTEGDVPETRKMYQKPPRKRTVNDRVGQIHGHSNGNRAWPTVRNRELTRARERTAMDYELVNDRILEDSPEKTVTISTWRERVAQAREGEADISVYYLRPEDCMEPLEEVESTSRLVNGHSKPVNGHQRTNGQNGHHIPEALKKRHRRRESESPFHATRSGITISSIRPDRKRSRSVSLSYPVSDPSAQASLPGSLHGNPQGRASQSCRKPDRRDA